MSSTTKRLSAFALIMLIISGIDSVRNLPATAFFGSQLIFFFIFSAIIFLIPTALVSAELATITGNDNHKSGIYQWVKLAFGDKWAVLTIWLQWVNTMVWFPTILSFIAGTITFLINPHLAQNKFCIVAIILIVFWALTLLNLKGIKVSAQFASICGLFGMVVPMFLIIILALVWLILGKPLQIQLNLHAMVPHFNNTNDWVALTAIMTSYLGMELAAVHVKDVENPQKTFPRAMLVSVIFILFTMIMGSLAIAFVLPVKQINLVAGTVQAFQQFLDAYHLSELTPIIVVMIFFGSLASMINWLISPAKGLLQAAEDNYLPHYFCHENKHGVASRVLIGQAVIVSFICLAFVLMPSVNGSYWLLTDLSTQIYILMYVLLFFAAIALKKHARDLNRSYKIPG